MSLKIMFTITAIYFVTCCYSQNTFEYAVQLYNDRQYQNAIDVFKSLDANDTTIEESVILYNIGSCFSALSKYDSAITYFNYALSLEASNAIVLLYRGVCYYAIGAYSKSINDLLMAIEIDSSNINSYLFLFDEYFELDSLNQALEVAEKSLRLIGDNQEDEIEILYNIGLVNYNLGNFNKTVSYFNELLIIEPSMYHAIKLRGISYFYLHNYKNAIDDLLKVKKLYKNSPDYNYYLGACLVYMDNPDIRKAIKYLNKGVKLGGDADAYFYRAIAFKNTYDFNKALNDLVIASKLSPEEENIIYELAYNQIKIGDYYAAEESVSKLRLIGSDPLAIEVLEYLIKYSKGEQLNDCDKLQLISPVELLELKYILRDDIIIFKEMQSKCN